MNRETSVAAARETKLSRRRRKTLHPNQLALAKFSDRQKDQKAADADRDYSVKKEKITEELVTIDTNKYKYEIIKLENKKYERHLLEIKKSE